MQFASQSVPYFTIGLIALTCWISYKGFKSSIFVEKYIFCPESILAYKEFYRLISSGFLHANVSHLLCNMVTLYLFGRGLEIVFGPIQFFLIYFGSIVGGSILSLWLHRNHVYQAYGASGGVCGVMFAHIFLFPGGSISMFMLPIWIPSWLYAILFMVGSCYGIKRQSDNIGHDAHLGGAIAGLVVTTLLHSWIATQSPKMFATISISSVLILLYLARNPMFLPRASAPAKPSFLFRKTTRAKKYDVDHLLDKISGQGMDSLTPDERAYLESVSDKFRRRAESKAPESELYF
ncbi:MAG: rhomboid family intramembrane serine protease [Verrucomicrobia bacterium]|nr:rhomboid family intramembrane serine protease [Verrucomicrobiota bacterium]